MLPTCTFPASTAITSLPPLEGDPLILIAEDVDINMELILMMLGCFMQDAGLLPAHDGRRALALALTEKPDLILLDIQMPEMNGMEVARSIRQAEQGSGRHVPVIALSAGVIKGESEKCLSAGMDDFLPKPLDRVRLYELLLKYLALPPAPGPA